MLKKVLLFVGSAYYPNGGWEDFVGSFDSIEAAKKRIMNHHQEESFEWAHIVSDGKIKVYAQKDNDYNFDEFKWRFDDEDENLTTEID